MMKIVLPAVDHVLHASLRMLDSLVRASNEEISEHIQYIKYNNPQSACALHCIQNVHEYGPLQDTMTLL